MSPFKMTHKFDNSSLLQLAMWNIERFSDCKQNDSYFLQIISNFHILGLVETWLENDSRCKDLPGFDLIVSKTRKKDKKARRNSGGISIYAKSSIAKGITKLKSNHSDICWVKLEQKFFGLQRDIYLAIIYLSLKVLFVVKIILKCFIPFC